MELENNIQDPRISGTQGIRGIRANDSGDSVRDNYFDVVNKHAAIATQSRHNLANHITEPQELAMGPQTVNLSDLPEDSMLSEYGKSKYDDPFTFQFSDEAIKDRRAEDQWGITKIGLGVAKGAITAGTTFLNNTGGLIYGAYQGISNKNDNNDNTNFIDGLWNNDITRATKAVSDWMEDTFKIYSSTKEDEAPWYSLDYLTSGAFLGDTLIKNLGFMVGSFYSGGMFTKGLSFIPKALGAISKSTKVAKSAQGAIGAALSAVGEGSIEAINNTDSWKKEAVENLKFKNAQTLKQIESERPYLTVEQYEAKKAQADEAYKTGLQQIERDVIKMGNMDLMLNIPILTFSNLVSWGKLYSSSFKTARYANAIKQTAKNIGKGDLKAAVNGLENSIKKPTARGVARTLNRMRVEGMEEMNQGWANEVSGLVAENDVMAYYKSKLNGDAYEDTYKDWHSKVSNLGKQSAEAFANTYGNLDNWEEFAVGAISSVFGMPKIRSFRNAETGKWQSPITFEGGISQDIKDARQESVDAQKTIDYLKQRIDDPKFIERFQNVVSHNAWDNVMQSIVDGGSIKQYKDAEVNQLITDLFSLQKANLLNVSKEILNAAGEIDINTQEGQRDLEYIKENDKSEVDVPNDVNDESKGTHKETVSARGWFDRDGNQVVSDNDIVKQIKDRKTKLLNYIEEFEKTNRDIDYDTNGVLSDDQLQELTWLRMRSYDDYVRMIDLAHDFYNENSQHYITNIDAEINNLEHKQTLNAGETKRLEHLKKMREGLNQLESFVESTKKYNQSKAGDILESVKTKYPEMNYLFDNLDNENINSHGEYIHPSDKNEVETHKKLVDYFKLARDVKHFENTFNEFMKNPGLIREQIEQIRNKAKEDEVIKSAKQFESQLASAENIDKFEFLYRMADKMFDAYDDSEAQQFRKIFDNYLRNSTNSIVSNYFKQMDNRNRYLKNYNAARDKFLKDKDYSDFTDDERNLVSGLDDNALSVLSEQLDTIFDPIYDGMEFDPTKSQISNNLQNVVENPNTLLSKELELFANKILQEIESGEKINDANKAESKNNETEPNSNMSSSNDLLSDDDIVNDDEEVEEGSQSTNTEGQLDKDSEIKNRIKELGKQIDDVVGDIKNRIIEFNKPEAERMLTESLAPLIKEISDLYNTVGDSKSAANYISAYERLKDTVNKIQPQTNNDDSNDLLGKINSLSLNELEDLLNNKADSDNGKSVLDAINLLDPKDKIIILNIVKAKIQERKNAVVVEDDTLNNSDQDKDEFDNNQNTTIVTQKENETPDEKTENGSSNFKNWIETVWDFGVLVKEKIKTLFSTNSQSVKFLKRFNTFDFVDSGILAILQNRYKTKYSKDLPIRFITTNEVTSVMSRTNQERRDPMLAIELDSFVKTEFNILTSNLLGSIPETIKIGDKEYYPIGAVGFYGKNQKSVEANKILNNLLYKEGLLFTDGEKYKISKYITSIAKIYAGRLYTSTDMRDAGKPRALKPLIDTKLKDPKKLMFGVMKKDGMRVPQSTETVAPLKQKISSRLGSIWIMIRGADGKLYPTATQIARFNDVEYNWRDNQYDSPIIKKMLELANIVCDENKSDSERYDAKFKFERLLGFPTDYSGNVVNPIVFKKIDGNDILSVKPYNGTNITTNIKGDSLEERVANFMDALAKANYKFNVSINELEGPELFTSANEYLQFIIESDIVYTNLVEPSFAAGSVEVYPLNPSGELERTKPSSTQKEQNFNTTTINRLQYSKADGTNDFFEYNDAGKVLNANSQNEKNAAEDIYKIRFKRAEYDGERFGGIYHKDGTDYYIQTYGANGYKIFYSNDNGYANIVNEYNAAVEKANLTKEELDQQNALKELNGESASDNVQSMDDFLAQQNESNEQQDQNEENNNEAQAIIDQLNSLIQTSYDHIAKILGKEFLSDEELAFLQKLAEAGYDVPNVKDLAGLNSLAEQYENCNHGGHYRFNSKQPATKVQKRTIGQNAKTFSQKNNNIK